MRAPYLDIHAVVGPGKQPRSYEIKSKITVKIHRMQRSATTTYGEFPQDFAFASHASVCLEERVTLTSHRNTDRSNTSE